MNEHGNEALAGRVERLEKDAEEVRDELRRVNGRLERALSNPGRGEAGAARADDLPADGRPILPSWYGERREGSRGNPRGGAGAAVRGFGLPLDLKDLGDLRSGEWWLNKVGIGLLLFGVAFLYLLSVERGWIGPSVRVGFGLAVGVALLVSGLRLYRDRRAFARVLLGGGVGTLYATGFAAYELYALVPYPVAFGFMVAVTILSFFLSLRQDEASLSLIGASGGLGTPLVLYDGSRDPDGLVLYACLILAGTGAVYLYKGWASLLGTSFVGGWTVLLIGLASSYSYAVGPPPGDQRILQLGVAFAWLLLWLAPAVREALRSREPAAWPLPAPGPLARSLFGQSGCVMRDGAPAHLASVTTPLVALVLTREIWTLQEETLGWISLGGAALYALAASVLRRIEGGRAGRVAYTQALVALLLSTLALVLLLEGDALFFALAAEAAVLRFVAYRLSDRATSAGAHLLFFIAAVWLGARLASGILQGIWGPGPTLVDLAVVALAFVSSFGVGLPAARLYRSLAHLAALAWLARGLLPLPDGDTWTLLSWALYAAGLYAISLRLQGRGTAAVTHALCMIVVLWLGARLIDSAATPGSSLETTPVFNLWGITDLAIIALLALAALAVPPLPPRGSILAYRLAAHVAFLAFLWRELSVPPSSAGDAYVTVAWGLYAAGLFVAGLRRDRVALVRAGLATLFLVVGKLFVVDLAQVDPVWRVLLFLGFGGLFLVLSYHLRSLWQPGAGAEKNGR